MSWKCIVFACDEDAVWLCVDYNGKFCEGHIRAHNEINPDHKVTKLTDLLESTAKD